MKKLIQLNLLLLLISSATAKESQPQQPPKTLRIYDWKDLAQQHQLSGGEVISMDGTSVLKIENTNDLLRDFLVLKISDPAVIKTTHFLYCDVSYENLVDGPFKVEDKWFYNSFMDRLQ